MQRLLILALLLLTVACSGSEETNIEKDGNNATSPEDESVLASIFETQRCPAQSLETVSMEQQEPMMANCNELHSNLRNAGIVAHGGVRPGVEAAVWEGLSEVQRGKVLLSAACQQSAGIPGPQAVVVLEAGTQAPVASETVCVRDPLQALK